MANPDPKQEESKLDINAAIDKAISLLGNSFPKEVLDKQKKLFRDMHEKQLLPYEAMNLNTDVMEFIYDSAYRLYNSGNYDRAKPTFLVLHSLDPLEPKYVLGLAASHHKLEEYETAIEWYMKLVFLDMLSPLAFYHAADCYIKLKRYREAILMLNGVIKRCGDQAEFSEIKERAKKMKLSLRKKPKKRGGE